MITTVSLNPSIDRTATVKQFTYGGMNRVVSARSDASGKAVNVAIAASRLEAATECIGFLYKENGRIVENRLLSAGTACDFLYLEGQVRTNIKLLDESTGKITEINEAGVPVSAGDLTAMLDLIMRHAETSDYLILNGSLPPGCPDDFYRTVIEQVNGTNCRCVLDAEGPKFVEGVKGKPFLIKPNLYELETALGRKCDTIADIRAAALGYIEQGVENVAVSMGDKGALLTNGAETLFAPILDVPVRSTVGAGDCMVAGLVAGFQSEMPLADVLRMGVAAANASVMTEGTQLLEHETYLKLLDMVTIERV